MSGVRVITTPRNGKHYKLVEGLCGLLADTYLLYNTTQVAHWNSGGPRHRGAQLLLERQYRDLGAAIDRIAARLREMGACPPGTLRDFIHLSRLRQSPTRGFRRALMQLIDGHEKTIGRVRHLLDISRAAGDDATADLLGQRLRAHASIKRFLIQQLEETVGDATQPAASPPDQGCRSFSREGGRRQVPV